LSNILVSLNPIIFGWLHGYQWAALLCQWAFTASVVYCVGTWAGTFRRIEVWAAGLTFTALYFAYNRAPVEMFFWFTGYMVYTTSLMAFFVFGALLYKHLVGKGQYTTVLALLCVGMAGCNEIVIFPLGAVCALGCASAFWYGSEHRRLWAILLAVTVLATLISILEPKTM
jgi:hypothetical protein